MREIQMQAPRLLGSLKSCCSVGQCREASQTSGRRGNGTSEGDADASCLLHGKPQRSLYALLLDNAKRPVMGRREEGTSEGDADAGCLVGAGE